MLPLFSNIIFLWYEYVYVRIMSRVVRITQQSSLSIVRFWP